MFVNVKITLDTLEKLIKLADWQLVELGYDPQSITLAWLNHVDAN